MKRICILRFTFATAPYTLTNYYLQLLKLAEPTRLCKSTHKVSHERLKQAPYILLRPAVLIPDSLDIIKLQKTGVHYTRRSCYCLTHTQLCTLSA